MANNNNNNISNPSLIMASSSSALTTFWMIAFKGKYNYLFKCLTCGQRFWQNCKWTHTPVYRTAIIRPHFLFNKLEINSSLQV